MYNLPTMKDVYEGENKGLFKVISTFAGCGGSSTGYRLAGAKILAINEFIPAAIDTYRTNYPSTIIFPQDIRILNGKDLLDKIGLKIGELDLLDGSPPCASFSIAGAGKDGWGKVKNYSDTKQRTDDLLFEYSRIIKEIKPKVFVAENVYGLVIGDGKEVFEQALSSFRSIGYNVKCKLLNAKYFGVPQSRQRVIFIGVRNDFNIPPTHPGPQTKPITVREALEGVTNTSEELEPTLIKPTSSIYQYIIQMKEGECQSDYHPKGNGFNCIRDYWDKPAATILQSHGAPTFGSGIHPSEHRKYTIKELKILSSFPSDFILTGTYAQQWERIGRAVPPLMMKAIAEHIKYMILDKINKVENNYNPPFYNEEEETKGQGTFNFFKEVTNFREYK